VAAAILESSAKQNEPQGMRLESAK